MTPIYQTIVDQGNGNCLQAVIASLFDVELNDVPEFISFGRDWYVKLYKFYRKGGYDCTYFNVLNHDIEVVKEALEYDEGINGYFQATVKSQTFDTGTHAVIVNSSLEIVHDPNPNQLSMKLLPSDIMHVTVHSHKNWYIDEHEKFQIR